MNLLLDTHALIWWMTDDHKLSQNARSAIASTNNDVYVSVISAFEIATKYRIGKLAQAQPLVHDFGQLMVQAQFIILPLDLDAATYAGLHDIQHKDPFDRLLISQALTSAMKLVTNEQIFDQFGVERLW